MVHCTVLVVQYLRHIAIEVHQESVWQLHGATYRKNRIYGDPTSEFKLNALCLHTFDTIFPTHNLYSTAYVEVPLKAIVI